MEKIMEDEERLKIKNKYELLKITRENYKNIRPKEIFVSGLVGLGMGHFGCFYLSALNPIFMPEFEFQPLIPNPAIVLTCTALGASFGYLYPKYVVYKTDRELKTLENEQTQEK